MTSPGSAPRAHVAALVAALSGLDADIDRLDRWGRILAERLHAGARLLACGNGGSAAHAEHLAAELVGRYRGERAALAAIALSAGGAGLTALANDYGVEAMFARQVAAHGRAGDVLVAISTSGRSPDVLAAVDEARRRGLATWALCGPRPNPLADRCDESVAVEAASTATVQEVHQVAVHLLCAALDAALGIGAGDDGADGSG